VETGPTNSTAVSLLSLGLFAALHLLRVSPLYNREYLGFSQFTYLLRNPQTGIFWVTVVRCDERCDCSPPLCSQILGWPVGGVWLACVPDGWASILILTCLPAVGSRADGLPPSPLYSACAVLVGALCQLSVCPLES